MYDAELVRQMVLEAAHRNSRPQIKTITTALRGYLRFSPHRALAAQGSTKPSRLFRNGDCRRCQDTSLSPMSSG